MLSPSSGVEVTRKGSRGVFIGPEEQGLRTGNWMGTNREPSGRLLGGSWVWSERKPFLGLTGGNLVLVRGRFMLP
jgi:hypothetical protein